MDNLTKIEKKLLKQQQHAFYKLVKKVRARVRKIKDLKLSDRKILVADLLNVNLDLMGVLIANGEFIDTMDYLKTINAYCLSEEDCYDYGNIKLAYVPGKMLELMEVVRLTHNKIDRYNELKEKLELNNIL
jgi:hypothetical protein